MGEVQINNRVTEVDNFLNGMSAVVFSQVYKRVLSVIHIDNGTLWLFDEITRLPIIDFWRHTMTVIDKIKTILIVYRWSQLTNQEVITSNTSIQGYKIAYKKRILQTFRPHSQSGLQKSICKAEFVNHGHKSVRFGLSVF